MRLRRLVGLALSSSIVVACGGFFYSRDCDICTPYSKPARPTIFRYSLWLLAKPRMSLNHFFMRDLCRRLQFFSKAGVGNKSFQRRPSIHRPDTQWGSSLTQQGIGSCLPDIQNVLKIEKQLESTQVHLAK